MSCVCLPGVFVGLGLSGVVPTLHFMIAEGFLKATTIGQMGWLFLMAVLYITGACLYAARIPERFFPGKCDIWVSSCPENHRQNESHCISQGVFTGFKYYKLINPIKKYLKMPSF